MRRRLATLLLALATLAVLPACDVNGPDPIGVTGTWEGEIFDPEDASAPRYPVELRMSDNGIRISGSGFVEDLPEGRFDFDIFDGSFIDGNLTLELRFDQPPFMGSVAGVLVNRDPGRIQGTFFARGDANGNFRIEITSRRT